MKTEKTRVLPLDYSQGFWRLEKGARAVTQTVQPERASPDKKKSPPDKRKHSKKEEKQKADEQPSAKGNTLDLIA